MLKLIKTIIISSVILVSLGGSGIAVAQTGYTLLEPSFIGGSATSSEVANFSDYIRKSFNTFLTIVVVVSILMIIIGGLEYTLSPLPFVKQAGLSRVWAAVGGLFLALISVLILQTINPDLVNLNLDFLNRRVGDTVSGGGTNTGGNNNNSGGGNNSGGNSNTGGGGDVGIPTGLGLGQGMFGEVPSNEFATRATLAISGISVADVSGANSGKPCTTSNVSGCSTYVGNLPQTQLDGIRRVKEACNCTVVITGAAEQGGHVGTNHYKGRAVDLDDNPGLDQFLESASNRSSVGIIGYRDERSDKGHWHLEF